MNLIVEYTDERVEAAGLTYHSDGACGLDLRAARSDVAPATGAWYIDPGKSRSIACGVKVAIPEWHDGEVALRSGHAFRRHLLCYDGKIDSDYRGEIYVLVYNFGREVQSIEWGERFAQLIIRPHVRVEVRQVIHGLSLEEVAPSTRGTSGFGSTGT